MEARIEDIAEQVKLLQLEVGKLVTFEANIKTVHTAHEEKITKTYEDANALVAACRTEFASIGLRLTNVEGRSRGGDKDSLMGYKDAVLPPIWSGEEAAAE